MWIDEDERTLRTPFLDRTLAGTARRWNARCLDWRRNGFVRYGIGRLYRRLTRRNVVVSGMNRG